MSVVTLWENKAGASVVISNGGFFYFQNNNTLLAGTTLSSASWMGFNVPISPTVPKSVTLQWRGMVVSYSGVDNLTATNNRMGMIGVAEESAATDETYLNTPAALRATSIANVQALGSAISIPLVARSNAAGTVNSYTQSGMLLAGQDLGLTWPLIADSTVPAAGDYSDATIYAALPAMITASGLTLGTVPPIHGMSKLYVIWGVGTTCTGGGTLVLSGKLVACFN